MFNSTTLLCYFDVFSLCVSDKDKKGAAGAMGPGGMSVQSAGGTMTSGQPNMVGMTSQSAQDPINALTNLAGASGTSMGKAFHLF